MSEKIDLLNRDDFINNVINVVGQLSSNRRGACFSIEGSWGIGKTFVLEKIEKQLKEMDEENHFVFHYNCWKHDYYEEPSVAIISAMLYSILEDEAAVSVEVDAKVKAGYEFVGEKLKEIAGLYLENKVGVNLISWAEDYNEIEEKNEKTLYEFDKMFNFSQTIDEVRKNLREIAGQRTVVIIVDELDRCVPQYAIKVLERLHHIFYGLENVIVILAIDRVQLEHSVEQMFGIKANGFNIERYLKKFIDFSMILNNGDINNMLEEKYKFYFDRFNIKTENELEQVNTLLSSLLSNVDIRTQEKIFEKANMVHSIICDKKLDSSLLAFEITYEIFKSWGLVHMGNLSKFVSGSWNSVQEQIGVSNFMLLKDVVSDSFETITISTFDGYVNRKTILNNVYGKIVWYFDYVFNDGSKRNLLDQNRVMDSLGEEVIMVQKYCKYCEIIK